MRRVEQIALGIALLLLVILTVQNYSITKGLEYLNDRSNAEVLENNARTHADIQLLDARIVVLEKDIQRYKGRDDVVKQITPLLEGLKEELKHVRSLQDHTESD